MATKADFTFDEWVTLRAVLDSTLLNIALADKILHTAEAHTWTRLSGYALPLVRELLLYGDNQAEDQAVLAKASHIGLQHLIDAALIILKEKVQPQEIRELSYTLRGLARAVAEADDEVDLKELRFLDGLDEMLHEWEV